MKKLKGWLFVIGAVLTVGAIGSEQIGVIPFAEAVKYCMVGLPMLAIGVR
jgi:hypothetical protein